MSVEFTDPEPSGLAHMIGDLIGQNLERDPARARDLDGSVVGIVAPDADVSVTVRLGPGPVVVSNGVRAGAQVVITASTGRLLSMASAPLRFGFPDASTRPGRLILADLLSRRVRIRGLLRSPLRLARFTRLLSVHERRR